MKKEANGERVRRREVFEPKSHHVKVNNVLRLLVKKRLVFNAKNKAIEVTMRGEVPTPKYVVMR